MTPNPAPGVHWFRRLMRHPIFPLICLIPLTQAVRDEYPVSHYPMYSQPTSGDLLFQYVTGADEKPLPITRHTGITPSQVGKKYGRHKTILIQREEKRTGQVVDERSELRGDIMHAAGVETLTFLRDQSMKRKPELRLTQALKLFEVTLGFGGDDFTETKRLVAELPAAR